MVDKKAVLKTEVITALNTYADKHALQVATVVRFLHKQYDITDGNVLLLMSVVFTDALIKHGVKDFTLGEDIMVGYSMGFIDALEILQQEIKDKGQLMYDWYAERVINLN